MAKFEAGKSGNESGRPRGARGRTSEVIRDNIRRFLARNISSLQKDYDKLDPKDRLLLYERLLKFVVPSPEFSLNKLSDTDLDILIDRLKDKHLTPNQNRLSGKANVIPLNTDISNTGTK
jgi:hypothetical protein